MFHRQHKRSFVDLSSPPEFPYQCPHSWQSGRKVKQLPKPGIKHPKLIPLQFLLIPSIFKSMGKLPSFFGFAPFLLQCFLKKCYC